MTSIGEGLSSLTRLRVAIVHDWLFEYAGAERVLEQIVGLFPDADLYAVTEALPPELRWFIKDKPVTTTFVQRLPWSRSKYRHYLPLMPLAIEQFDLSGYNLVISSSHAVAKGVITGPDQLHISYVHSPMRYAWDLQHQYLSEMGLDRGIKGWVAKLILHRLRIWDARTALGVDHFIANSRFIQRRITKLYRRDAEVVYPPVDVEGCQVWESKDDYYLTASRMVPYKRVGLVVDAFNRMPDRRLTVIGDGPEFKRVRAKAGPNVSLLGYQDTATLRRYMQRAKAFVFAAEEDFGIAPVEAQACGTPVIAFGKGGVLETVRGLEHAEPTGVFFPLQEADAIIQAVREFETNRWRVAASACRASAERFSIKTFRQRFYEVVQRAWEAHVSERPNLS